MSDVVLFDVVDHVATMTINRAERRNALSPEAIDGLAAGLDRAKRDPDVRVPVLTGAGDRAFCAGADLGAAESASFVDAQHARGRVAELFRAADGLGKPTIAKVRGYALAAGFGLALMCDLVMADDSA